MISDVQIYNDNTWSSIIDFVLDIDRVPFITRNRDFSPKFDNLTIKITAYVGYQITKDHKFRIYSYDNLIYEGSVISSQFSQTNFCYDVTIKNNIESLLTPYLVDSATLHSTLIANGGDLFKYNPNTSTGGKKTVQVLWLMQKLFSLSGLTLDVTSVQNVKAFDGRFHYYETLTEYADVPYKMFCIDEDMLYYTNQTEYYKVDQTNPPDDFQSKKLNFYQLFCELCSIFGFCVFITGPDSYKLAFESNYVIDDDYRFEIDDTDCDPETDKAMIEFNIWASTYRHGEGAKKITWLNNLLIYSYGYYNQAFNPSGGYLQTWYPLAYNYVTDVFSYNPAFIKARAILSPYKQYKYMCPIQIAPQGVVQNHINIKQIKDPESLTSEIIQEVY